MNSFQEISGNYSEYKLLIENKMLAHCTHMEYRLYYKNKFQKRSKFAVMQIQVMPTSELNSSPC